MIEIVAVAGTIAGAQYALAALCISCTYRASRVLNLAQGGVALAAATLFAVLDTWPAAGAFAAAVVVSAALGAALERTTRVDDAPARLTVVIGWLLTLVGVLALRDGLQPPRVPLGRGTVGVLGIRVGYESVALVVLAVAVPALLWLVLERSRVGARVVAVADAPAAAEVLGVDTRRVRLGVWVTTQALVGVLGVLAATATGLDALTSLMLLAAGLAAALLGGVDRLVGPVVAGFSLGWASAWLGGEVAPSLRDALVLCVVVVALVARRTPVGGIATGRV